MERWNKSLREDRYRNGRERGNPSFSSTLLDAIYRSIDEGGEAEEELVLYRETMRKKHSNCTLGKEEDEEMASLRRAIMIEKWMEKKVSEKVVVRRKSIADFERRPRNDRDSFFLNSTSSSSDSSSGGGFSSSEAESVRSSGFQRPKPIRTSTSVPPENHHHHLMFNNYHDTNYIAPPKPKHEGGFVKTKSRALKIYGDLKKVKQPISPGGRLASFLNSLFTAGTAKKAKIASSEDATPERKSKFGHTSACSSASSFSRSCLSKTPSTRGKLSNGAKRSVRFYPVSVIVDEDCRPCGHKCLYEGDEPVRAVKNFINEDIKLNLDHNRRVEEAARDLLKNYQKKNESYLREAANNEDFDDEDDDDAASYASSDLFELDNLSAIGIDRYREELPVYETTRMDTNRAIASGLIL